MCKPVTVWTYTPDKYTVYDRRSEPSRSTRKTWKPLTHLPEESGCLIQMPNAIRTHVFARENSRLAYLAAHALVFTLANGWSCMTSTPPRADSQNTAFRRPGASGRQAAAGCSSNEAPRRRRRPAVVANDTRWVLVFARAERLREPDADRSLNLVSSALEAMWGEWWVVGDFWATLWKVSYCYNVVKFDKQEFCSTLELFLQRS